ncbi:hypothetical protein GGR51DRAFT_484510 [Nemania sp. FL0031]|nr:hypothetical protein GGR51DRAFT_484510 [Nemania sp. FL0031]
MIGKDNAVGWQTNPSRRGTLMIIQNCLFTIFACTWSIQHPNVPRLDEDWLSALLHKYMRLLDEQGLLDNKPPWFFRYFRKPLASSNDLETGSAERQNAKWSLTHCYIANMGGFYIDANGTCHSLTSRDLVENWERVNIPRLSEDDLKDKSKTDYFTKALAVIQITQLLLLIISREVEHLAIS